MIVAPGAGPDHHRGVRVTRVRSVGLPGYRSFPLGLPDATLDRALTDFRPDVVHLASPIVLGVAGFARQYGIRGDLLLDRWVGRVHRRSDRTLVPSQVSYEQLRRLAVTDPHIWRRGVSLELFDPSRRDDARHQAVSSDGRDVLVGYVGRLAAEKNVRRLAEIAEIADIPGIRLVVVGEGPERAWLGRHLPRARPGLLPGVGPSSSAGARRCGR